MDIDTPVPSQSQAEVEYREGMKRRAFQQEQAQHHANQEIARNTWKPTLYQVNEAAIKMVHEIGRLIAPNGQWIKGAFALDDKGAEVLPEAIQACSWCLTGAFRKAKSTMELPEHSAEIAWDAIHDECEKLLCTKSSMVAPIEWQDHPARTKDEVLAMLDKVVRRLESSTT